GYRAHRRHNFAAARRRTAAKRPAGSGLAGRAGQGLGLRRAAGRGRSPLCAVPGRRYLPGGGEGRPAAAGRRLPLPIGAAGRADARGSVSLLFQRGERDMRTFWTLVGYEYRKIFRRRATWAALALGLVFLVVTSQISLFGGYYLDGEFVVTNRQRLSADRAFDASLRGGALVGALFDTAAEGF